MEKEMPTFTTTNMDEEFENTVIKIERLRNSRKHYMRIEQRSVERLVQHRGILIESGIMENSHNYNSERQVTELIGDCYPKEKTEETVKQTREEFVEQLNLDAKYAHLKGILIEKGIVVEEHGDHLGQDFLENAENLMEQLREEYAMLQLRSDIKPANLKEFVMEKGLIESWEDESVTETDKENVEMDSSIEMTRIINDINQLTANLETDPNDIDWGKFRSNLLKIHQHYIQNVDSKDAKPLNEQTGLKATEMEDDPAKVDNGVQDVMEPLNEILVRSKKLSNNIEYIENKISSLDLKVERFYARYQQTLLSREKALKDMITLQAMRERIGQRLTHIEMEIHASKTRLLHRGMLNK